MVKERLFSRHALILWSLLVAVLFYLLTHYVLHQQITRQLENDVQKLQTELRSVIAEVRGTLVFLNRQVQDKTQCNPETIVEMRRALFKARYGKDIGFYVDDLLVCTTGLGLLETPFQESGTLLPGPDGLYLRFDQELVLFDRRFAAIIVKHGAFNVVLDPQNMFRSSEDRIEWEVALRLSPEEYQTIASNVTDESPLSYHQDNYRRTVQQCSDKVNICITSGLSDEQFWRAYSAYIQLAVVATILVWLISFIWFRRLYRRFHSMHTKVKRALKKNYFYCLYQPIVELEQQRIIGFEVLARCRDTEAVIYPDQFISCVRDMEKTWEFTCQIIECLVADLGEHSRFPPGFRISLNIFPADINNGDVLHILPMCQSLQHHFTVMVEITEDELLGSQEANLNLTTLSQQGIKIAVDDFGTGYANIAQLQELQCDLLKIDRSYTSEIEEGAIKSALIRHVVSLSKDIDVDVVAEGIENTLQLKHLKDLGVKYGQGYLFSKPVPMKSFISLMHQQKQSDAPSN